MYQYLTGSRFRQRVEGIIEKFEELKEDLDKERKFMARLWAKREGQIHGVIEATAAMYGDLQGIAGMWFSRSGADDYSIQSGEILARPALSTFVDLLFSVVGKQLGTDYLF